MVVSNLLFDALLYGSLWVALLVDMLIPALHGAATLVAVCGATYLAAEDGAVVLSRRGWWSQDSLATALSLSTATFIYYWWRNDSDLVAVVLHIGLMMASLMILIGVVAACSAAYSKKSGLPLAGLLATCGGALFLGLLAGVLVYFLTSASVSLPIKFVLPLIGLIGWKVRETLKPPAQNDTPISANVAAAGTVPGDPLPTTVPVVVSSAAVAPAHPGAHRVLIPQRGTLLDRFLPVLVMCAAAFAAFHSAAGIAIK